MILVMIAIIVILVIVGIHNTTPDWPKDWPEIPKPSVKPPADWEKIAKEIYRLHRFSEKYNWAYIKHEGTRAKIDVYMTFQLEKEIYWTPKYHKNWCAIAIIGVPDNIAKAWNNRDASIMIDHRYMEDPFLEEFDRAVSICVREDSSYIFGYLSIPEAYSLNEIRSHVNPILRRMGTGCTVAENRKIKKASS